MSKTPPKPTGTTAKWTTDKSGVTHGSSFTPGPQEKPKDPALEKARLASRFGLYQEVLDTYPEFGTLIAAAVKDYKNGSEWSDEQFWAAFNATQYAKDRTKAEELYDIGITGPNADTYNKKVNDTLQLVKQSSLRLGLPISDQEAMAQATHIVRSDLSQGVVDAMWGTKYLTDSSTAGGSQIGGEPLAGAASQIQSSLRDQAHSWGLNISDELLRTKTGEALGQGERWQEYLQGQDDFFRNQAKLLYPNAAHLFDTQNLKQISEGYLQEASSILGTGASEMDITDPKWTAFLNGPDGKILGKDEWTRVLRTDSKYGYDKSLNARKEYSNLTDGLFAAFGMA